MSSPNKNYSIQLHSKEMVRVNLICLLADMCQLHRFKESKKKYPNQPPMNFAKAPWQGAHKAPYDSKQEQQSCVPTAEDGQIVGSLTD